MDRASLQSCIRLLVALGADVNHRARLSGWTTLLVTALDGDINILKLFLESGADVNAVSDSSGWSALVSAVAGDHSECVQLLIQSGADVNVIRIPVEADVSVSINPVEIHTVWENSLLGVAVEIGNIETIKLLLQGGAHTDGVSSDSTPGYEIKKILEVARVYPMEDVDTDFTLKCREVIRKHLQHVHSPVNMYGYLKKGCLEIPLSLERSCTTLHWIEKKNSDFCFG